MPIQRSDSSFIYHKIGGQQTIFEISDEDIAADPSYFGYLNETGAYIIQQRVAGVGVGTYRYVIGTSGYAAAWAGRALLVYTYFNLI